MPSRRIREGRRRLPVGYLSVLKKKFKFESYNWGCDYIPELRGGVDFFGLEGCSMD
jgi:hypothetical protein